MNGSTHPLGRAGAGGLVFVALVLGGVALVLAGGGREGDPARSAGDAERPAAPGPNEAETDSRDGPAPEESWTPPDPPAAKERRADRREMVEQIADRRDGVTEERVLEAMRTVPRHEFVPSRVRGRAYQDTPLPIGHGQTISQPYMVAKMTELLELEPDEKVLEIGTGSGYQAAVLAHLTPHVYTIEIIEPLHERAARTLEEQAYEHVETKRADGYHGWEEHAPFDAIIVTAAAGHVPPPLWEQLEPGGRMVIPIGGRFEVQRLLLLHKTEDGGRESRSLMPVRFVPFTREQE